LECFSHDLSLVVIRAALDLFADALLDVGRELDDHVESLTSFWLSGEIESEPN
jgi:hypothetical protein